MATARVEEAYSERDETIDAKGNVTEIEVPYLVFGVEDESAALAAARYKAASRTVSGMALSSVEMVERINGDTWKVKAVYEADDDGESSGADTGEEDVSTFAFDTRNAPAPKASGCPTSEARSREAVARGRAARCTSTSRSRPTAGIRTTRPISAGR